MKEDKIPNDLPARKGVVKIPLFPGDRAELIGSRCQVCNFVSFPRKLACPVCVRNDTMVQTFLSGTGKIISFTTLRISQPGFVAPYILAEVQLYDGPRIISQILGTSAGEKSVNLGDEVEIVLAKVGNDEFGNNLLDFRFKIVPEGLRKG